MACQTESETPYSSIKLSAVYNKLDTAADASVVLEMFSAAEWRIRQSAQSLSAAGQMWRKWLLSMKDL